MKYNPDIHHRRSIRLRGYDYTQAGAYFVTACAHARECLFGEIVEGEMRLNAYGQIALECWQAILDHCAHVNLDAFVVMPNHVHGILLLVDDAAKSLHLSTQERFGKPVAGSLPTIVRLYKAAVTRHINELRNTPGAPVWQRNYYEHIIRDQASLDRIRAYIASNPSRWEPDQVHADNLSKW
jgi:REP element-mobilizing transposase RayT